MDAVEANYDVNVLTLFSQREISKAHHLQVHPHSRLLHLLRLDCQRLYLNCQLPCQELVIQKVFCCLGLKSAVINYFLFLLCIYKVCIYLKFIHSHFSFTYFLMFYFNAVPTKSVYSLVTSSIINSVRTQKVCVVWFWQK